MIDDILAIVVDFRSTADAERLTRQLSDSPEGDFSLTVVHVDNGNPEPVTLSAEQEAAGVRLVRVSRNGGYASGIRRTIDRLRREGRSFDAFWLLNSDVEVEADTLPRLVDLLGAHPSTGAVGPTILRRSDDGLWGARGVVSPLLGTTAMEPWSGNGPLPKWSYVPGCSMLVRADAYDEVDGIPERYGMYYEETHLCVQLQRRGWELRVEPSATVRHGPDDPREGLLSPHRAFYFARNNLYFWRANFGIPWYLQLPRTLAVVLKHLILPLWRAPSLTDAMVRLRYIGMGLFDGFVFLRRRSTPFERKHFGLAPEEGVASGR